MDSAAATTEPSQGSQERSAVGIGVRAALGIIAVLGFGSLSWAVLGRVGHAWPLEWMEGATVMHALRLLAGEGLYVAPSAEFIPNLYPPLSYLPIAGSMAAFGPTLWAARLPSVLCLLGSTWLIGSCASRLCHDRWAGLLSASMWALGFGYTGAFMDLARVDSLFVLLLCVGMQRTVAGRPMQGLCWFALSCFAKQHGLIFLGLLSMHTLWQSPALRRQVVLVWAALCASFALGQVATGGWFGFYTFELPAQHGAIVSLMVSFVFVDLALYLPVLSGAAFYGLAAHRRSPRAIDALLLAGIAASALGRAHVGGFDNVRLPAFAIVCVVSVAALWPALCGPRWRLVTAGLVLQAAVLLQAPSFHLPQARDTAAFVALRDAVRECGGGEDGESVVALDHAGWLGQGALHTMALSDLQLGGGPHGRRAAASLVARLESPSRPGVLVVGAGFPALAKAVETHYRLCQRPARLRFVTGYDPPRASVYVAVSRDGR